MVLDPSVARNLLHHNEDHGGDDNGNGDGYDDDNEGDKGNDGYDVYGCGPSPRRSQKPS